MCIINEHHYVLSAQSALTAEPADFSGFAKAVNHSHENLRDFYDISCLSRISRQREISESVVTPSKPIHLRPVSG
jgi:galactokinase